jgi:hypothetical protein
MSPDGQFVGTAATRQPRYPFEDPARTSCAAAHRWTASPKATVANGVTVS